MVSRYNNAALHLSTFLRERTHRLCVLLVRYLLAGGFQTLLGAVSDFPAIAFQEPEWKLEFSAVDTHAEYHHSVFSGSLSFPPLILTLNIIIPYSVGVFGYLLFKFVLMQNKLELLQAFFASNFQKTALLEKLFNLLFFIGIGTALTFLFHLIGWQPDRFLRLVLVLGVFALVQKLLSPIPKTPVYYVIIGFACVWLSVRSAPSVPAFFSGFAFFFGLYLVVFVIAKQLVLGLASIAFDHAVDVNGLRVGMIPAEQIIRVTQPDGSVRYERKQVGFASGWDDNVVVSPDPAGLDAEDIAHLQDLAAAGALVEFENQIRIQPSIRFAPVISIGALLTILCQGPFYLKLMQLF